MLAKKKKKKHGLQFTSIAVFTIFEKMPIILGGSIIYKLVEWFIAELTQNGKLSSYL